MKKDYILTLIIFTLVLSGCENDNPNGPASSGNISGKVIEQGVGNPVANASISTEPSTITVTSDSSGNYIIYDIEAGNYILTATKNGYAPSNLNVNVKADQTITADITITNVHNIPIASFNYSGTLTTPAVITFQNTSQNADEYYWEFGDGTNSTEVNPQITYNQYGNRTVTLTATNNTSNLSNQISQEVMINPGKVFLQAVTINAFPIRNENGEFWDDDNYPDVYYTVSDSALEFLTSINNYIENLHPSILPATWYYISGIEFQNWSTTYFVELWDYDSPSSSDFMGSTDGFNCNQLTTYPSSVQLQNPSGSIQITLTINWQ
jgi:PKD repeat protein